MRTTEMANVVYKYEINPISNPTLELPSGYEILSIKAVGEKIFLWALVDPEKPLVYLPLTIVGTGRELMTRDRYLETVLLLEGELVLHIFQRYQGKTIEDRVSALERQMSVQMEFQKGKNDDR